MHSFYLPSKAIGVQAYSEEVLELFCQWSVGKRGLVNVVSLLNCQNKYKRKHATHIYSGDGFLSHCEIIFFVIFLYYYFCGILFIIKTLQLWIYFCILFWYYDFLFWFANANKRVCTLAWKQWCMSMNAIEYS